MLLYIVSMVSLFALRKNAPELERPFRAPFYPVFPAIALGLAVLFLVAAIASNPKVVALFFALLVAGAALFRVVMFPKLKDEAAPAVDPVP